MRSPSSCDDVISLSTTQLSLTHPSQPHHPPGLRLAHLDAVRLKNTEIVVERDAALPILVQLNNNKQQLSSEENIELEISISLMGVAAAQLNTIRKIQCELMSGWWVTLAT